MDWKNSSYRGMGGSYHRRRQRRNHPHHHHQDRHISRKIRSFKEELFLESDSEVAFQSDDDEDLISLNEYDNNNDDDEIDLENDTDYPRKAGSSSMMEHHAATSAATTKPISLVSWSSSSSARNNVDILDDTDEGDDDSRRRRSSSCWGSSRRTTTNKMTSTNAFQEQQKSVSSHHRTKLRKSRHEAALQLHSIRDHETDDDDDENDDDLFYRGSNTTAPSNTFYVTGAHSTGTNMTSSADTALWYPSDESRLLVPSGRVATEPVSPKPHHTSSSSSFFTFASSTIGSLTPPSLTPYARSSHHRAGSQFQQQQSEPAAVMHTQNHGGPMDAFSSPSHFNGSQQQHPQQPHHAQFKQPTSINSVAHQKTKRRKKQPKRRRGRCTMRSQTTVPRHLRLAHTKARAITERFLGLLRAETEKVMLFAQSRLGELADTAGSLRFPSFDDEYASSAAYRAQQQQARSHNHSTDPRAGGATYEFGDGGMHPSASSSSDEGDYRTDSSSEKDENSHSAAVVGGTTTIKGSSARMVMQGMYMTAANTGSISNSFSGGGLSDDHTPTNTTARTRDMDGMQYVRRQIAQFAALRKNRAVFQRSEQILGEDMLFLSAVEEADGYTAVGVELMHVLKYVCVNLIAVRKICRKHDRLLMNRMLGGYYKRLQRRGDVPNSFSRNVRGVNTLGGMLARVSGDVYEAAHPALIGHMNHYKLVGIYDKKIQKLANSRTVQAVSSCLALSLSEYEVARSRANALTHAGSSVETSPARRQHQEFQRNNAITEPPDDDDDSTDDPPTTASSISLTRLRYTVMSIFALREVSRSKLDYFLTYLSRSTLAFTGVAVAGDGLDGCSRETLDFIVSYDPDAALLRDSSLLYEGLKRNLWSRLPLADVMVSTLAVGTTPAGIPVDVASELLLRDERIVAQAVSASPESRGRRWRGLFNGPLARHRSFTAVKKMSPLSLSVCHTSFFLFTMNYFVVHATTTVFLQAVAAPSSYSALIIGTPNVSAGVIAIVHCWYGSSSTRTTSLGRYSENVVRNLLLIGSASALVGNVIHAVAFDKGSVAMSITGRFIFGFSSIEILQREIILSCSSSQIISESARFLLAKVSGTVAGLALGTVVPFSIDMFVGAEPLHARQLKYASWLLVLLWLVQFVRIYSAMSFSDESSLQELADNSLIRQHEVDTDKQAEAFTAAHDSDSDSSASANIVTPSSALYGSIADGALVVETQEVTFDDFDANDSGKRVSVLRREDSLKVDQQKHQQIPGIRQKWSVFGRLRKWFGFHVGIRVSLCVFVFATFALEVFYSSSPMIVNRYFGWDGANAGTLLGCLALLILPILLVSEIVARRYEERTTVKRSLGIVFGGLLVIVNWESMFSVAKLGQNLFADVNGPNRHQYDGSLGVWQYTIGLTFAYVGLISLEGAALSLLSKVSPPNRRSILVQAGTIVTFLGLTARVMGNLQIVAVDLSHKLINTDIVNSLVVPLVVACLLLKYLVQKNFFFLM